MELILGVITVIAVTGAGVAGVFGLTSRKVSRVHERVDEMQKDMVRREEFRDAIGVLREDVREVSRKLDKLIGFNGGDR
jgi:hypothetical protein